MEKTQLRGDVQGRRAALHDRLPRLFEVCRAVVEELHGLGSGVLLQLGRVDGPFTEERWRSAQRRLESGQSTRLTLSRDVYFPGGSHSAGRYNADLIQLHVDLDYEFADDVARVELTVERERDQPIDTATALSWLIDLTQASGLAQANLHPHDYALPLDAPVNEFRHMYTLQEELHAHDVSLYLNWPASMLERFARGAAWVLYLNESHVAGLGGAAHVTDRAPVEHVAHGTTGTWLILTENPDEVSEAAMVALEQYLAPILPSVDDVLALTSHEVGWAPVTDVEVDEGDRYIEVTAEPVAVVRGRVGMEMTLGVMCDQQVTGEGRAAIVRCVKAWVDDGTQGLFGGSFHGWMPGEWDDSCYELDVDTGSQELDWRHALTELTRRLGACAAVHNLTCSLRIGEPT